MKINEISTKCKIMSNGGGALSLLNKDNVDNLTIKRKNNTEKNSILSTSLFRVF